MGRKPHRHALAALAMAMALAASVPVPTYAAPAGPADAALFRAAGLKQSGRIWISGCNDSGEPPSPATIEERRDLNGDGRPEAVITESGSYCYGNTGQAFWLVSQQADGGWKLMATEVGIPDFLKTKGVGGWPDIAVGGPGFCFDVLRWNGRSYAPNRREYDGKPCR
jgi:hypothetical protein